MDSLRIADRCQQRDGWIDWGHRRRSSATPLSPPPPLAPRRRCKGNKKKGYTIWAQRWWRKHYPHQERSWRAAAAAAIGKSKMCAMRRKREKKQIGYWEWTTVRLSPFFFFYIPAILFLLPAQLTFTDKRERDTQRLYSAEQMEKKKMRAELQKNKKKEKTVGGVTLAAASSRLSRPDIYIYTLHTHTHTHNDKKD